MTRLGKDFAPLQRGLRIPGRPSSAATVTSATPGNETERFYHAVNCADLAQALVKGSTDTGFDAVLEEHGLDRLLSASIAMQFSLDEVDWFSEICEHPHVKWLQQRLPLLVREAEVRSEKWVSPTMTLQLSELGSNNEWSPAPPERAWMSIIESRPWTPAHDLRLSNDDIRYPKIGSCYSLRDILAGRVQTPRSREFYQALNSEATSENSEQLLAFLRGSDGTRYLRMLHRMTGTCWAFMEALQSS